MKHILLSLVLITLSCVPKTQAALTDTQAYKLNLQNEIIASIWMIKAANKGIFYEIQIIQTKANQLKALECTNVPAIDFTDINAMAIPDWSKVVCP